MALLAGVILLLLGHAIGGLAPFGGSILAAVVAVAGMSGMRHLRKLVTRARRPGRAAGRQPIRRRRAAGPQRVHRGSLS
ncbi:MAG TPA: hypothetical protein VGM79_14775 [Streptosporangiaceae bacterium]|jgi:hypothetical protein